MMYIISIPIKSNLSETTTLKQIEDQTCAYQSSEQEYLNVRPSIEGGGL